MLPQTHILGRPEEQRDVPEPTHAEATASTVPPSVDAGPGGATEIGGRDGPEPTRFGDWEKNGRCIDF